MRALECVLLVCVAIATLACASPVSVHFAPTSTGKTCDLSVATSTNATVRSKCKVIWKGLDPLKVLQTELKIIDTIIEARLNDTDYNGTNADPNNKYRIRYSVYNLLLFAAYPKLIAAFNAGIYVQVLIESSQVDPCRSYNTALAALRAGGLRVPCFTFNTSVPICNNPNCTYNSTTCTVNDGCYPVDGASGHGYIPSQLDVADPAAWNLLPIMSINSYSYIDNSTDGFNGWNDVGLMHTKMRLFDWEDADGNHSVVISGSLNPDSSAPFNDETLFISEDPDLIAQYSAVYQAVLTLGRADEATFVNPPYNASKEYNLFFSKGGILGGPQLSSTINQLISQETELILITVYTLRDFGGLTTALQTAAKNGAFIAILTDLDEVVGEPGFAAPDPKCSTMCFGSIPLRAATFGAGVNVPVYGCKNANGMFSAFHHKNMVIGASNMRVLTDTTNWSGSGAGINYNAPAPNCCAPGLKPHETYTYTRPEGTWTPPSRNAQSAVGNCETALWINEGANSTIALQFVDTFFYLINKYYVYTMSSVGEITDPEGAIVFPNATFINNTATVYTGVSAPVSDVFANVMHPKDIARLMLKMPSLAKNPALAKLIAKYA